MGFRRERKHRWHIGICILKTVSCNMYYHGWLLYIPEEIQLHNSNKIQSTSAKSTQDAPFIWCCILLSFWTQSKVGNTVESDLDLLCTNVFASYLTIINVLGLLWAWANLGLGPLTLQIQKAAATRSILVSASSSSILHLRKAETRHQSEYDDSQINEAYSSLRVPAVLEPRQPTPLSLEAYTLSEPELR